MVKIENNWDTRIILKIIEKFRKFCMILEMTETQWRRDLPNDSCSGYLFVSVALRRAIIL